MYIDKSIRLFHGSPKQNLKIIEPRSINYNKNVGHREVVFASPDVRFASCYGAKWRDNYFGLGTWDDWNTITVGISELVNIHLNCSLYEIENDGTFEQIADKEVVSDTPKNVIKEWQYESFIEMMKSHNIEIITYQEYVKRLPFKQKLKYLYKKIFVWR